MNEQQKEYTVKRIEKYKKDSKEAGLNLLVAAFLLGGSILLGLYGEQLSSYATTLASVAGGPLSLSWMIYNICQKVGLENRIADLQYQLDLANLEETEEKGRGL